eukprot:g784.t1
MLIPSGPMAGKGKGKAPKGSSYGTSYGSKNNPFYSDGGGGAGPKKSTNFGRDARDAGLNAYASIWQKTPENEVAKFSPELLDDIYSRLKKNNFPKADLIALEFSGLLEKYLWPHVLRAEIADDSRCAPGDFAPLPPSLLVASAPEFANKPPPQLPFCGEEVLVCEREHQLARSHVMLIVLMFLEKFRDSVDGFRSLDLGGGGEKNAPGGNTNGTNNTKSRGRFALFFSSFCDQMNPRRTGKVIYDPETGVARPQDHQQTDASSKHQGRLSKREQAVYLQFLTHCFNSYEEAAIRDAVLNLVALPTWLHLGEKRLEEALSGNKQYRKFWKSVKTKYGFAVPEGDRSRRFLPLENGEGDGEKEEDDGEKGLKEEFLTREQVHARDFMAVLLRDFFESLEQQRNAPITNALPPFFIRATERFLELLIDLMSQLPFRKCFRPLLADKHFVVRMREWIGIMRARFADQRRAWIKKGGGKGALGKGRFNSFPPPDLYGGKAAAPAPPQQAKMVRVTNPMLPGAPSAAKSSAPPPAVMPPPPPAKSSAPPPNFNVQDSANNPLLPTTDELEQDALWLQQAIFSGQGDFHYGEFGAPPLPEEPLFTTTEDGDGSGGASEVPEFEPTSSAHVYVPDAIVDPRDEVQQLEELQSVAGTVSTAAGTAISSRTPGADASEQELLQAGLGPTSDNMIFAGGIYPEDDVWRLSEQLLGILEFYEQFEVDDATGASLHRQDVLQQHYDDHNRLRKICFAISNGTKDADGEADGGGEGVLDAEQARLQLSFEHHSSPAEMRKIALSHVGDFQTRPELRAVFAKLSYHTLREICTRLCYLDVSKEAVLQQLDHDVTRFLEKNLEEEQAPAKNSAKRRRKPKASKQEIAMRKLFLEVLYQKLEQKTAQLDKVNALPLFPAEDIVWDKHLVPDEHFQNDHALALPKLNLQFLTIHDYLLRNFHLFRLESTYSIRDDLRDVIPRMRAVGEEVFSVDNDAAERRVRFLGSARMGVGVDGFRIMETKPPRVKCEIRFSVAGIRSPIVQREWNQIREHDVVFLVALDPPSEPFRGNPQELDSTEFPRHFGIREVRGVEVFSMADGENNVLTDFSERREPIGADRIISGWYDPAQYLLDNDQDGLDLFGARSLRGSPFHVLVRRNPKENNFKAVLETIRDLMNSSESAVVPKWLHRLFLGYGDPLETQYKVLGSTPEIDFRDTFLDREHVFESFPECRNIDVPEDARPPFKLRFETGREESGGGAGGGDEGDQGERKKDDDVEMQDTTAVAGDAHVGEDSAAAGALANGNKAPAEVLDHAPNGTTKKKKNKKKPKHRLVASGGATKKDQASLSAIVDRRISGSTYFTKNPGPYPHCLPNLNKVRFTPVQVDAIRSGVNEGLTMVVGPPGTGKTDTAVQIVNLLFHNFPDQKIVLVAHSNQALNDLFDKICQLDIPERYLVRLGRGIEELDSERDFSKYGRIDFMLKRRLELLELMGKLARCLGQEEASASYTCETAKFFFLQHVQSAWERFLENIQIAGENGENLWKVVELPQPKAGGGSGAAKVDGQEINADGQPPSKKKRKLDKKKAAAAAAAAAEEQQEESSGLYNDVLGIKDPVELLEEKKKIYARDLLARHGGSVVAALFPFAGFFDDLPAENRLFQPPPFTATTPQFAQHLDEAEGCFQYLQTLWKEIAECLPFEMLRSGIDRGNYLVTTHARIIAMTCTHAALTRANLVKLNFQYDNLIMEESAQILEVETLIPMLLQKANIAGESRLKRVVLIGDHHQLPPVVKNRAFQKYGHLDQSLFTRFIRLNVPHVMLDAQGRARPSIANLYNWRYATMKNLPNVTRKIDYRLANTGLIYDYQFIDVQNYNGRGESTPMPYYYQNEGEAEYAVALFMFMRLLGYPAGSISIITTYNGQKALIRDVIQKRCSWNPLYGWPKQVTTVDKYQGQQNEYIILSLVRTSAVGHLRDVRRLVVAMSRSKLGLYVLGRFQCFNQCYELQPVLKQFKKRPLSLALYKEYAEEFWPCERFLDCTDSFAEKNSTLVASGVEELWKIIGEMQEKKAAQLKDLMATGAAIMEEPKDVE